ncbi:MAG: hypothetical protein Q4C52_06615 [Eubacteriales bacterium]|nr:hypothetical protein [Eubacteriales bacterium]
MDNQFDNNIPDNVPEDHASDSDIFEGQSVDKEHENTQNMYSDPNAGYTQGTAQYQGQSFYQNPNSYSDGNQYQYQQQYQQPNYGYNPYYNNPNAGMDTSPMTMGDWVLTLLALMIPCAGIILYFVWAFGSHGNINRRNFCRAQLIILGVVLILYLVLILVLGVSFAGAVSTY